MMVKARRNQVDGNEWRLTCTPVDNKQIFVVDAGSLTKARTKMTRLLEDHGLDTYFELHLDDDGLQEHLEAHRRARKAAHEALKEADRVLVETAKKLNETMTLRDVALLMGYSHQYIATLVKQ